MEGFHPSVNNLSPNLTFETSPDLKPSRTTHKNVQAALYFLKKDALHQVEKPYAFRFPVDNEGIRQSNMEMVRKDLITITDIRGPENSFSLEINGFAILNLKSKFGYDDFHDPGKISRYFRELEAILNDHMGASHVKVLDMV